MEIAKFPDDFIIADEDRREISYLRNYSSVDIDIGDQNDFEITMTLEDWDKVKYDFGFFFYAPNTEYGGIIEERKTDEDGETVTLSGYTWRGLLAQKIIEPSSEQAYRIVSGDAHTIIKEILSDAYGDLFQVSSVSSGFSFSSYQFDRYITVLEGFNKMLLSVGARLSISYIQENGYVELSAVAITDWSSEIEYSQDNKITFSTKDYRRGINHLICGGEGELTERLIVHLYVQEDGSVGTTQFYYGSDERVAFYDYTSAKDKETLIEYGTKRLEEQKNYQEFDVIVGDVDVELGDIVGGRERVTGLAIAKTITQKILTIKGKEKTIKYKVGD